VGGAAVKLAIALGEGLVELLDRMSRRAISLFSGAGGDTLGLERAGYKVVAFSEMNKAAIETHLANFPESVHLRTSGLKGADITQLPDSAFEPYAGQIDVVFAGFPCFTAGTLVLTETGYKPVETVNLEDKLLTHTGTFKPIVNLQRKIYSDTLYEIRPKYHGVPIVATKEHPFYVRNRTKKWNTMTHKYDSTFGAPEWKKAEELSPNDYFGMPVNQAEKIPEFTVPIPVNKAQMKEAKISLDKPEHWYMMGYFVGDGWVMDTKKSDGKRFNHTIRFSIADKDTENVLPKLQTVLTITDKKNRTGACGVYGCADLIWWTILKEFGKYAHGKRIPEWVQDAPKEMIQEFIAGYQAADGCIRKDKSSSFTTVSPDLALGLQRLYLKLGKFASVVKTARPPTCVIQGRTVNQRDTYTVRCSIANNRYSSFIEDGYAWFAPGRMTTRVASAEAVYNFEVADDNSYCVENIIVHNCQGFSKAGKKKATDTRNQLFRQFVRVVKIVRPRRIIGENVPGLLNMASGPAETDPPMIEVIRQAFQEIGYAFEQRILEATDFGVPQKRKRLLLVGAPIGDPMLAAMSAFWQQMETWGSAQPMPKLRSFTGAHLIGAQLLKAEEVPEGFDSVALEVGADATVSGTPHPYVALKAGQKLLSCSKRASPIHSEVVNLDKPSKTIICTYDHQPRLLVGLRRGDQRWVRMMTPDELKQIQGFPADYLLRGNLKEQIVQVGNAVPPALVEAIARHF
jgi:site-specific DNA-cytosine methylase/intein/homing endonuclease